MAAPASLTDWLRRVASAGPRIGATKTITLNPTVDTNVYAAGDLICEKLTVSDAALESGGSGVIQSVVVVDQAKQDSELDLIFFDSDPDATTFTENAALDIADADLDRVVAIVTVYATDYRDFSDNAAAVVANIGQAFTAVGSADLYLAVVSRGTPVYAAAGDLRIRINILQD